MTTMLRVLIGDVDKEDYSDDRLKELLSVAAFQVNTELNFEEDYVINVVSPNIVPDPTTINPTDDAFVNLVTLKAACIIDRGSLRLAAMTSGLEARCGPVVMRTLRRADGFLLLMNAGYCAAYEEIKKQYMFGNISWCRGILSPFVNTNFDPSAHNTHRYGSYTSQRLNSEYYR